MEKEYSKSEGERLMYKRLISAMYVLNIVFQAFYTLALPIGICALVSFLLTKYASAPGWIWAVLIVFGVFTGLYSMIKFILTATKNLDRIEKGQEERAAEEKKRNKRLGKNNGTE